MVGTLSGDQKRLVEEEVRKSNKYAIRQARLEEAGGEVTQPETGQQQFDIINDTRRKLSGGESGRSGP